MSNFLETQPRRYNDYVGMPVDTYSAVGMYKQAMYEQGVQQIQTAISTVAGLEVARPVDKQYLESKVNEVTSKINSIAGGDWSNKNLVSKATGIASSVAKDNYVQDAIYSAAEYKNRLETLKKVREKGDGYSPQNEWDYLNDVDAWMKDPTIGKKLGHKEYSNYIDLNDQALKYFKDKHPNSILKQDPITGEMGAYVMIEGQEKYISAADVQNEFRSIVMSDPKLSNQLRINTNYNIQNQDPVKYFSNLEAAYKSNIDSLEAEKKELEKEKSTITDPTLLAQYDKKIKDIETSKIPSLNKRFKDIKNSYDQTDPTTFMYQTEVENYFANVGRRFAFSESSTKIVENPIGKIVYEHEKDRLEFEYKYKALEQARLLAENKNKGVPTNSFGKGPLQQYDANTYIESVKVQADQLDKSLVGLLQMDENGSKFLTPYTNPDGSSGYTINNPEQAKRYALEQAEFYKQNSGNDPALADAYRNYGEQLQSVTTAQKRIVEKEKLFEQFNPEVSEIIRKNKLDDSNKVLGVINNQSYTQQDLTNAYYKYSRYKDLSGDKLLEKATDEKEKILFYNLYLRDHPVEHFVRAPIQSFVTSFPPFKTDLIIPDQGIMGNSSFKSADVIGAALKKTVSLLRSSSFEQRTKFLNEQLAPYFKNENNYFHPLQFESENDKANSLSTINTIAASTGFGDRLNQEYFKDSKATSIATRKGTSEGHDVIVTITNPNINDGENMEIPMSLQNASLIDPSIGNLYTPKTKMELKLSEVSPEKRTKFNDQHPYETVSIGPYLLNIFVRVNPSGSISIKGKVTYTDPKGVKVNQELPPTAPFPTYDAAEKYLMNLKNKSYLQPLFEK